MTDEQQRQQQNEDEILHGRNALIGGIVVAELMVIGPMIALLPTWMAVWEPRFVGLLIMTMAAPLVMLLPTAVRVRVAEAVAASERQRSATIAEITGHPELIPAPAKKTDQPEIGAPP